MATFECAFLFNAIPFGVRVVIGFYLYLLNIIRILICRVRAALLNEIYNCLNYILFGFIVLIHMNLKHFVNVSIRRYSVSLK